MSSVHAPRALVVRAPGTNCDAEMVRAFRLAGADPDLVHIQRLLDDPALLARAELIGFPGGFSYGDDIASGRLFAVRLRERLWPALRDAARRGTPIIGACNGFQVLVQCGLLPGHAHASTHPGPATPPPQTLALTDNASARFVDTWVGVRPAPSPCLWLEGVDAWYPAHLADLALRLPIAHGEGRLVAASPDDLAAVVRRRGVVLRYDQDINGSSDLIAGICDPSGRVFGLMPHPERFLDWSRHPFATRLPRELVDHHEPFGLKVFRSAVDAVRRGLPPVRPEPALAAAR